jgi:predicted RNase H-like nuclease (RuvC/YqgF family)
MNKKHHIEELEAAIERIKKEPASSWIGKLGKSIKIQKIERKIKSLKKELGNDK